MSDAITPQSTTAANTLGNGWSIAPATSQDGGWLVFASDSTNLSIPDAGGLNVVYLKDTKTGTLTPISLASTGQIPNSNSTTPVISDDGRYVAFQSNANNLTGTDNNNDSDIFWKDTQTGTLKLLSGTSGTAGNNASGSPAISTDGRYVVFQSYADNLANNDTNGAYDIYLADTQTGAVTPVSLSAQNSFGDQNSVSPSISANGQVVAFASDATNLVTNDTNVSRDVFVKNVQTGVVTLVSANTQGQLADGRSDSPALSADGSNVAFLSNAPNLGKAVNDGYSDIYVKNLANGTLKLVSADISGQQANANSWSPVINQTGKYVAFLSDATNLISGDTNGFADIFVKEISTGKIGRISADSLGGQIYRGPELNKAISISNDGKWIFFSATSSTSNGANEVFKVANPLEAVSSDTTAPTAVSFSPANNATGIGVGDNIIVTFSEAIQRGTGNIVLKTAGGTVVATYDATTSSNLTISGSTLTINPTADLSTTTTYTVEFSSGSIKDLANNGYAGTTSYTFTTASGTTPPPVTAYTVPGTLGNDVFVISAGNTYRGGGGDDTYIISPSTLSGSVTASIADTQGTNVIQLVDGMTVTSSIFYNNEVQLTLSTGAKVNIPSASKFSFQVGANAPDGDAATTSLIYAQFASLLGISSLPSGSALVPGTTLSVPVSFTQAPTPTPLVAGTTYTVPGTLGNDVFVISAGNTYRGGGGNDTYIISPSTLSGSVTASIADTQGTNVIQLVDGMTVTSSIFYNNEVQLTLSTGAKVNIPSASKFSFQVGANAPAADIAPSKNYAEFGAMFGISIPAGSDVVNGKANFIVPSDRNSSVVDLSTGTVTATAAAEEFRYDFKMVAGHATKAGDGEVSIIGFDTAKDKLVFVDTTNHTVYTEAQFKVLPGVEITPFTSDKKTTIYFDPDATGVLGGVTLVGIVDGELNQIVVETM